MHYYYGIIEHESTKKLIEKMSSGECKAMFDRYWQIVSGKHTRQDIDDFLKDFGSAVVAEYVKLLNYAENPDIKTVDDLLTLKDISGNNFHKYVSRLITSIPRNVLIAEIRKIVSKINYFQWAKDQFMADDGYKWSSGDDGIFNCAEISSHPVDPENPEHSVCINVHIWTSRILIKAGEHYFYDSKTVYDLKDREFYEFIFNLAKHHGSI